MKNLVFILILLISATTTYAESLPCDSQSKDSKQFIENIEKLAKANGLAWPKDNCTINENQFAIFLQAGSDYKRKTAIVKFDPLRVKFLDHNSNELFCLQATEGYMKNMGPKCPQW
jgi:hypothetical protein